MNTKYPLSESLRRVCSLMWFKYGSWCFDEHRGESTPIAVLKWKKVFSPLALESQGCRGFSSTCLIFMLFSWWAKWFHQTERAKITLFGCLENSAIKIFSNEKFYVYDDGFGIRIKQRFNAIIRRHLWRTSSLACLPATPLQDDSRSFQPDSVNIGDGAFSQSTYEALMWWILFPMARNGERDNPHTPNTPSKEQRQNINFKREKMLFYLSSEKLVGERTTTMV